MNLTALRRRAGEHGPALANYVEWGAILEWLKRSPAINEPIEVATVSCELVREGRAIRAQLPLPGLPKFASIGRMSRQSRSDAIRIAEHCFAAWRDAGRPCLSPATTRAAFFTLQGNTQ